MVSLYIGTINNNQNRLSKGWLVVEINKASIAFKLPIFSYPDTKKYRVEKEIDNNFLIKDGNMPEVTYKYVDLVNSQTLVSLLSFIVDPVDVVNLAEELNITMSKNTSNSDIVKQFPKNAILLVNLPYKER